MEVKRVLDLKDSSGEYLLTSEVTEELMKEAVFYLDKKTHNLTDEQFMVWVRDKMENGSFGYEDKVILSNDVFTPEFAFVSKNVLKLGVYISYVIDILVEANGLSSPMPDYLTNEYEKKANMKLNSPSQVLFIKLGKGGEYCEDCIKDNYLKFSYDTVDHDLCIKKDWDSVYNYFITEENATKKVARSHTNQIKQFYEENEDTLWITFYANKLWWCYSKPEIKKLHDNKKIRPVIGKWSDKDLNEVVLLQSNLSGKLLKTHGFQGTICKVSAQEYVIAKIKGEQNKEVAEVKEAFNILKGKLKVLIEHLQPKDFEILVDLIFRQMGWQRVSVLGEQLKTIDIELISPVTGERGIVQIKTGADLKDFRDYKVRFAEMDDDFDKFFFVVSSPKPDLENYDEETKIIIYFSDKISELTISSGLVEWVRRKTL